MLTHNGFSQLERFLLPLYSYSCVPTLKQVWLRKKKRKHQAACRLWDDRKEPPARGGRTRERFGTSMLLNDAESKAEWGTPSDDLNDQSDVKQNNGAIPLDRCLRCRWEKEVMNDDGHSKSGLCRTCSGLANVDGHCGCRPPLPRFDFGLRYRLNKKFPERFNRGEFPDLPPCTCRPGTEEKDEGSGDDVTEGCKNEKKLSRIARDCVRLLKIDAGLEPSPGWRRARITCGTLRATLRGFYKDVTCVQELSIKTAQKCEPAICGTCEPKFDSYMTDWKEGRFREVEVDDQHLQRFTEKLWDLVPWLWNVKDSPFIPNGHATKNYSRRKGGNWNREEFDEACEPIMVVSSGKPRIVTLYSGYNTEVLTPLHRSLYSVISREGYLLVGPPTEALLRKRFGKVKGTWVSVDYKSATDNIKAPYVAAAVSVLKRKADSLTREQIECLDVLANLVIEGIEGSATRGQPMGSVMSFPILCLINRAVVSLACDDANLPLDHPCLINGDDLLLKDPTRDLLIYHGVRRHGALVGLVVNEEKTMVDPELAEINSTLFRSGQQQKKTNLGALKPESQVSDVLGFADEACRTLDGFMFVVKYHRRLLESQAIKVQRPLVHTKVRRLFDTAQNSRWLSEALTRVGYPTEPAANPFPVVEKPFGYDLPRDEQIRTIGARVEFLREQNYVPPAAKKKIRRAGVDRISLREALTRQRNEQTERVLEVLARRWREIQWEGIKDDHVVPLATDDEAGLFVDGKSRIDCLASYIKERLSLPGICREEKVCVDYQNDDFLEL